MAGLRDGEQRPGLFTELQWKILVPLFEAWLIDTNKVLSADEIAVASGWEALKTADARVRAIAHSVRDN